MTEKPPIMDVDNTSPQAQTTYGQSPGSGATNTSDRRYSWTVRRRRRADNRDAASYSDSSTGPGLPTPLHCGPFVSWKLTARKSRCLLGGAGDEEVLHRGGRRPRTGQGPAKLSTSSRLTRTGTGIWRGQRITPYGSNSDGGRPDTRGRASTLVCPLPRYRSARRDEPST